MGADPENRRLRLVDPKENRLAGERGDELEELRAGELKEGRWLWGGAPALQEGERGKKFGGGRNVGAELNLDRDRIARRGGRQVGREQQTKHRGNIPGSAEDAKGKFSGVVGAKGSCGLQPRMDTAGGLAQRSGMAQPFRCLINAGPTREHIDPVRFLSNGSSGKMGYALAEMAVARGWSVDLVSGPVALAVPAGVRLTRVVSAAEMLAACEPLFVGCDVFIAVAAVSDYRPRFRAAEKTKKTGGALTLELEPTVDILKTLAARKTAQQTVVGFAAETRDVEDYAQRKLVEKKLDWIVANDVSQPGIGMDAEDNAVILLSKTGQRDAFGPATKRAVAEFILERILS